MIINLDNLDVVDGDFSMVNPPTTQDANDTLIDAKAQISDRSNRLASSQQQVVELQAEIAQFQITVDKCNAYLVAHPTPPADTTPPADDTTPTP